MHKDLTRIENIIIKFSNHIILEYKHSRIIYEILN